MKKVLITGGNGFLGANIIRELLERSYSVRALIETGTKSPTLEGLPIEMVNGNILDSVSLDAAFQGCNYLIHAAASTNIWPTRSAKIFEINVQGTRNILAKAKEYDIKKMIHIGTANTFGFGDREHPGNETRPYASKQYGLDYMDSKYEAHQVVLQAVKDNLPVSIVNPTFMLGPYDSKPSSGEMIRKLYLGKIPGYTKGGRNFIHVKDAAVGVVNALETAKNGESYILGNQNLSYYEFFNLAANVLGTKAPGFRIPAFLSLLFGWFGSTFGIITGKAPQISLPIARISCDYHFFTPNKAVTELKLPQTPIENAVKDCFDWLNQNGYLS